MRACEKGEDLWCGCAVLLLLYSHSPNDVPLESQRNVSIAAVRGAVRPPNGVRGVIMLSLFIL